MSNSVSLQIAEKTPIAKIRSVINLMVLLQHIKYLNKKFCDVCLAI